MVGGKTGEGDFVFGQMLENNNMRNPARQVLDVYVWGAPRGAV